MNIVCWRSTCSTLAINVMSTPALSSAVTGQSGGSSSLQTLANSLMGGPLPTSSALADEGDQSDQSPEGSATEGLAAPQNGFWDAFVLSPPVVSVSSNVHTATPTQDVGQGVAGMVGPGPLTEVYSASWDPTRSMDWDNEKTSQPTILRIKRDIMSIYKEPPPGMFIVPDPQDMTKIHALITGPFDTPYEGGFFLFLFRCPPDYPIHPPRVKLITTGQNTVRFNPNFYRNGKVCLSILGTWTGPAWSPAQSISSVLISIQSLMTEKPYHNEPGFEQDPFGEKRGRFDYQRLQIRLGTIHKGIREKLAMCDPNDDSDSETSSSEMDPESQGSIRP
ncbi:ubiquitin-conjugating enzyme E2 Z isoform X4 [Stigmatopora nigra]